MPGCLIPATPPTALPLVRYGRDAGFARLYSPFASLFRRGAPCGARRGIGKPFRDVLGRNGGKMANGGIAIIRRSAPGFSGIGLNCIPPRGR